MRPKLHPKTAKIIILLLTIFTYYLFKNYHISSVSAASMTLTLPANITLSVTPDGTLKKSSASSFSAKTDGAWGYSLSIKAKSTADMVNATTSSAKLTAISKSMPESEYTAAGNNNTWGYMPSILNSQSNTDFIAATTSATVLDKTTSANASAAKSYSITLGAKADSTAVQGTYSNSMVLTLSANTVNYNIIYNLNSGSWSGTSPQTGITTANSITLDSHSPTKSGYTFQGWCSTSPSSNNSSSVSCSGYTYQPSESYPLSRGTDITLYAIWKQTGPNLGNLGDMQSFTCSKIANTENYGTATDTRDNNTYSVAKLKDGLCWMTQNLKIGSNSTTTTLRSSDTDISSNFNLPAGSTTGFNARDVSYIYINNSYGGYYSYYAATAGEGGSSFASGDTSQSICPKRWRLPTKDEASALIKAYSNNTSRQMLNSPANFTLAGGYNNSKSFYVGTYGPYWLATKALSSMPYHLFIHGGGGASIMPSSGSSYTAEYGLALRCVARQ